MSWNERWERVSVSDVCESITDCVNKTAPTIDGPTPFKMLRTTNVRNGWIDLSEVKYVTEEVFERWNRRGAPEVGDVILTREAPLGEVGMIRHPDSVFLGQRLVMYRADTSKLDPRFLLYAFQGHDLQAQIRALGSGATVAHMRVPDAKALTLLLPPLPLQTRIADILSAYDDLIENNSRRIAILEEMAQAIYREWFVNFRFPGHEQVEMVESELGTVPEGWEVRRLGDEITLSYGKALKADDRREGAVPVYGSSGVVGYHDEALVRGPGIVVGRKGNVGSVHWCDNDFYPIDTTYYVETELDLFFVYFNLNEQHFINNDSAVPGLNRNQAYSLPLMVPSREVLGQFNDMVRSMFAQHLNLRRRNALLRETRDFLLPRLISGEIEVGAVEGALAGMAS